MQGIGTASLIRRSVWLIAAATLAVSRPAFELDFGRYQKLVGTDVLGTHVKESTHVLGLLDGPHDCLAHAPERRLADQEALHLEDEYGGDHDEEHPDRDGPVGVPPGVSGDGCDRHAEQCERQADERPEVL